MTLISVDWWHERGDRNKYRSSSLNLWGQGEEDVAGIAWPVNTG
ncbi:MAG: hypothetical protein OEM02_09525 [Desulfobulbaceae bacterium]|nr:hypothetical protein [Desulfobulbaceae bacterium]